MTSMGTKIAEAFCALGRKRPSGAKAVPVRGTGTGTTLDAGVSSTQGRSLRRDAGHLHTPDGPGDGALEF